MSEVIAVTGLGKAYKHYPSRWARLAEWLSPTRRIHHTPTWVLKDVDLRVSSGEAVGIVGFNGAGKSTLLKILAGTTQPTVGDLKVRGPVAALLELGMGFHAEFTGRQNVLIAGQLIGHSPKEMNALLPRIEEFAEIGAYFDEPLRTYSSGMQMRLAFSLATARRPEVLIVDEALSVGDAYFQHKSFSRIREFREQGTTLLIVSHDRFAIQALCDRAVLLHEGRKLHEGDPESVMDFYHAMMADRTLALIRQRTGPQGHVQTASGTGEASLVSIRLINAAGAATEMVKVGETARLELRFRALENLPTLVIGLLIKDRLGQSIYGINTHRLGMQIEDLRSGSEYTFTLEFPVHLGEGHYSVAVALTRSDSHLDRNYEWTDRALIFHVANLSHPRFVGSTWLPARASFNRDEEGFFDGEQPPAEYEAKR